MSETPHLKEGTVVRFPEYSRFWVVLNVTQDHLDSETVDVEAPGLYAFGGMWYGDDPLDPRSYGKVLHASGALMRVTRVGNLALDELKALVD